jgi:hypothetical protein
LIKAAVTEHYVGSAWDQASSIILAPGVTAPVFVDASYAGTCLNVTGNITNLTQYPLAGSP